MSKKNKIKPRWKAMRKIINMIIANPQHWDQQEWHSPCGTSHCFAGFTDVLNPDSSADLKYIMGMKKGYARERLMSKLSTDTMERAQKFLRLSDGQAEWLFAGHREFAELYFFVQFKGKSFEQMRLPEDLLRVAPDSFPRL